MFFKSDNSLGVPDVMFDAMRSANEGPVTAYGNDPWTEKVNQMFCDLFEREVAVFMVSTGTAANALSLAACTPPWGAVICHQESHIMVDECGATEFYSGGAKLMGVWGENGKLTPAAVTDALYYSEPGNEHYVQPAALSLTQVTEVGSIYSLDEIGALSELAKSRGFKVHMDGARFANACVALDCSAAEMTWKSGVDVLSFGATKNGAIAAEAVVLFDLELAEQLNYRRMRGGHLLSKSRFPAAQLIACLQDDLWRKNAEHANAMSWRLAQGLYGNHNLRHAFNVDANLQFIIMKTHVHEWLQSAGAHYYLWPGKGPQGEYAKQKDEVIARLVCGFSTTAEEVDEFIAVAGTVG